MAITSDIKRVNIRKISIGFEMLTRKHNDDFLGYELIFDYHLKQQGITDKYKKLPSFDNANEFVIALKKNKQGDKLLHNFDLDKKSLKKWKTTTNQIKVVIHSKQYNWCSQLN